MIRIVAALVASFMGLSLATCATRARAASRDFDEHAFAAFMQDAAVFERQLYACPLDASHIKQCEPKRGSFDAKMWLKVQDEGRRLFR